MIDKVINTQYGNVIKIAKALRLHAKDIYLLDRNTIAFHSLMEGVKGYAIIDSSITYPTFLYSLIELEEIRPINSSFKKTKSDITFTINKDHKCREIIITVTNKDGEDISGSILVVENPEISTEMIHEMYYTAANIISSREDLIDEPDSLYTSFSNEFIQTLASGELCEFIVNGNSHFIAKPFLGNLKKTEWIGYRLVYEDDKMIILKFKQKEEFMNIYTYGGFLKTADF